MRLQVTLFSRSFRCKVSEGAFALHWSELNMLMRLRCTREGTAVVEA